MLRSESAMAGAACVGWDNIWRYLKWNGALFACAAWFAAGVIGMPSPSGGTIGRMSCRIGGRPCLTGQWAPLGLRESSHGSAVRSLKNASFAVFSNGDQVA